MVKLHTSTYSNFVPLKTLNFPMMQQDNSLKTVFCSEFSLRKILRISPYSVRIRENAGEMQTRINANTNTFYALLV